MKKSLEKKVEYFFSSPHRGRSDVRDILTQLRVLGEIALIGGMLRDLTLFGNLKFLSDVDLVIDAWNLDKFESKIQDMGGQQNRFGGFSLPSGKWQIDVWPLQETWAHTSGHVKVNSFIDLINITFFDCDAIFYNFSSRNIFAKKNYFDKINNRIIDINLKPNPNPNGNAVRAFRYALIKGFSWGPELTLFIAETLDRIGWDALAAKETHSYGSKYIEMIDEKIFMFHLHEHLSSGIKESFCPTDFSPDVQLELPII